MSKSGEEKILKDFFFSHFLYTTDTRLARISDDIYSLPLINGKEIQKYKKSHEKDYLRGYIHQDFKSQDFKLTEFLYAIVLVRQFEIEINLEPYKGMSDISFLIFQILFSPQEISFSGLSKYLKFFYLTIYLAEISSYIGSIKLDLSDNKEVYYYHMLNFVDTSFYNTDYKKSYYHLLEAEKIFPQLSQIYAFKVRTLYLLGFNHYKVEQQFEARKNLLSPSNPIYQRIQQNINLSYHYAPQNKGMFIFELALYLHCGDWMGIKFFLKNYHRRKEFFNSQRSTMFLWIGKFFSRKGYIRQAQYYLYYEIGEGNHDFSIYKARFLFSIVSKDSKLFEREKKYLLKELQYQVYFLKKSGENIFSDNDKEFYNIYQDSNIILPARQDSSSELILENIDIQSLEKSEKGDWEYIFLFLPHKKV